MANDKLLLLFKNKNTVFTFKEIALLWQETDINSVKRKISYYVKTKKIFRLRKGIYVKDKDYNKFELATKIYKPSYISFETVLSQSGVIFQFYSQIFVASYLTREIELDGQKYFYRKIKGSILTDPTGLEYKGTYWIATKERAFLDTLYLNKNYYFDNISVLDKEKIFEILPIYKNKSLEKRVKEIYGF
jgi:predicted transcriptional regulator of viral defense system